MGVRGVGEGGVVGQMELLEHNTAHTKETQEFESQTSPSHANTDITAETAPQAHMHERTWLHTHKHRLIKQHMLLFLLPGAAGGTPFLSE